MELEELQSRLGHLRHLESRENGPETPQKAYLTMEDSEKNRYIEFLLQQKEERDRTIAEKDAFIKNLQDTLDMLKSMHESDSKKIDELKTAHEEDARKMDKLISSINDLTAQLKLKNKQTYADKSQKGISKKGKVDSTSKPKDRDRDEERENFDGTNCEKPCDPLELPAEETTSPCPEKEDRPNRQGMNYDTMQASRRILHKSDLSKLPDGAEIIRIYDQKYSFEQHVEIIQHDRQMVVYKTKDGRVKTAYLPYDDEDVDSFRRVPGTHATSDLIAYIIFNKYLMETPFYRELKRLMEEDMRICDGTLSNWLSKGVPHLKKMIPYLLAMALEKDAIVNCDETWCRVRMEVGGYKKKYIWCLVNKSAHIVIYLYDDGSRGREVLRDILKDTQIAALQSDGYNVYMYIDNELDDVDHLCCMAHARAKFKYAYEQGGDERALSFLEWIGQLYGFEEEYKLQDLPPEEIKRRRNDDRTTDIMIAMSTRLNELLLDENAHLGDMMQKALRYLNKFWKQLFTYRKDGRYSIDNNIAERNIRPLTVERKNSLFFGNHAKAEMSALYHTFIATCQMMGMSVLKYFKSLFSEIAKGRTDYENMLPMTISLCKVA